MGYNHASAFVERGSYGDFHKEYCYGKSPMAEFEGPVVGFKPKIECLRSLWLKAFIMQLEAINPNIPRDTAIEWVNFHFPKTEKELSKSIVDGEPEKLAFRLADAWDATP